MALLQKEEHQNLDMEWVGLILSARKMGLGKEDVRSILRDLQESGSKEPMKEETSV